ncbi:MAG: hypothetical protein AB7E47_13935 [Desulfovibrionaceae bacterium]
MQITVPDGGEDGRVAWGSGESNTDFFPSRFCVFQAKAKKNIGPTDVKKEIWKKGAGVKGKPKKLNEAAAEVISKNGSYILFTSVPLTGAAIQKCENAIRAGFSEAGSSADMCAAICVYDANKIAAWCNGYLSIVAWVHEITNGMILNGLQSIEQWSKSPDIARIPWIDDGAKRFVVESVEEEVSISKKGKETKKSVPKRNTCSFIETAQYINVFCGEHHRIIRVVGASGYGKTRFLHEAFSSTGSVIEKQNYSSLIYVDGCHSTDGVYQIILQLADMGREALIIVDECNDSEHARLADLILREGARLRLVTVDLETHIKPSMECAVVRIERSSDELISKIALSCRKKLSRQEVVLIKKLATGFPRMAVAASDAIAVTNEPISSVEKLINKIIWGSEARNRDAERSLEAASLFDVFGVDGDARVQLEYIAEKIAIQSDDVFYADLDMFVSRGVMLRRGDYVQVQPLPLAAIMAGRRLKALGAKAMFEIFKNMPGKLKDNFYIRLQWLDTSPHAKELARLILAQFGTLESLNTEDGSKCLHSLVHVIPDFVMEVISRVFGVLDHAALQSVGPGRRYLVWTLEKLAFRKASFTQAASLLLRLAVAETEDYGNNASGVFEQLFFLHLSGTEAEPALRLPIIDSGLQGEDIATKKICIQALGNMLERRHFSRSGGSEELGSGIPLQDWEPKTYGEIFAFHRAAITRLTRIACSGGELSTAAKDILGHRIRTLICPNLFADLVEIIDKIQACYGFWSEGLHGVNQWLYFDSPPKKKTKFFKTVREYYDNILPVDPVDLAIFYSKYWPADLYDPDFPYDKDDNDFSYAQRMAENLAELFVKDDAMIERALEAMLGMELASPIPFWHKLSTLTDDQDKLFLKAVEVAESLECQPTLGVIKGILLAIEERDKALSRVCIRIAIDSSSLRPFAIDWVGVCQLADDDLPMVESLLGEALIKPHECVFLSYGQGLTKVTPGQLCTLLKALQKYDQEGLWAAVGIIRMYCYGQKEIADVLVPYIKSFLLSIDLFYKPEENKNRDFYNVASLVESLSRKYFDDNFVISFVKKIFDIFSDPSLHALNMKHSIRKIVNVLIQQESLLVWSHIESIFPFDGLARHRLKHFLRPDSENHNSGGILYGLPSTLYLNWAAEMPAKRFPFVLEWIAILDQDNGKTIWHPIVQGIVTQYGNVPEVLNALGSRLYPTDWVNSRVPYLTPYLPLLVEWFDHDMPSVSFWARHKYDDLQSMIEKELKESDERSIGVF